MEVTFRGETKSVRVWANELGFRPDVVVQRLQRGWDVERALTEPVIQRKLAHSPEDIIGRLTLVRYISGRKGEGKWECRCECGNVVTVRNCNLGKNTWSCGCLKSELVTEKNTTHGRSKTKEYRIWASMIGRCHNLNDAAYPKYGARGVTVCGRWRFSFEDFLADMGEAPSDIHSVDRFPNRRGNYEPGNVRWATPAQQSANRDVTRLLTHNGETYPLRVWARKTGMGHSTLKRRLDVLGWDVDKALSTPPRRWPSQMKVMPTNG